MAKHVVARIRRSFDDLSISTIDWPIILMEFPERLVSDTALHDALSYFEHLLMEARGLGQKTYTVTDLSRMYQLAPASQRKYVSDWMSRTVLLQKAASLGGANVTPSSILRGLITAIYWFVPAPVPVVFVASRRDAYAEALRMFDNVKVSLAADVRAVWKTRR